MVRSTGNVLTPCRGSLHEKYNGDKSNQRPINFKSDAPTTTTYIGNVTSDRN